MKLLITKNRSIREVQDDFNKVYPFLKIEFFIRSPGLWNNTGGNRQLVPSQKIGESGNIGLKDGEIDLSDRLTVRELEEKFQDQFSLFAQIFRKSGNIWMETTKTENWTLRDQNEHGREISSPDA